MSLIQQYTAKTSYGLVTDFRQNGVIYGFMTNCVFSLKCDIIDFSANSGKYCFPLIVQIKRSLANSLRPLRDML